MSRGPGHVETSIIDVLRKWQAYSLTTASIAEKVYDTHRLSATHAQRSSVHRALCRLEKRGLVARTQDNLYRELRWTMASRRRSRARHQTRSGDPNSFGAGSARSDAAPKRPSTLAGKFIKVLGMLGSDQSGERASAALAAEKLRMQSGLTWADIIRENLRFSPGSRSGQDMRQPPA
jgi:hypothetical protein